MKDPRFTKIRVLDNLSTGFKKNIVPFLNNPNVEFLEGDIRDRATIRQAVQGMDAVCHQAALGSVPRSISDPQTTHDTNATGLINILWAAKEAGVKRMTYASSSSVYGDAPDQPKREGSIGKPMSPYAVSKHANELYAEVFARNYSMTIAGFRYFNVFGPRQDPDGPYAAVVPFVFQACTEQYFAYDQWGWQHHPRLYPREQCGEGEHQCPDARCEIRGARGVQHCLRADHYTKRALVDDQKHHRLLRRSRLRPKPSG